jgi:hypothetical protein
MVGLSWRRADGNNTENRRDHNGHKSHCGGSVGHRLGGQYVYREHRDGQDGRQVKIRTLQGESFSLDVANPEVIKGVNKGDQVSLELDSQDRVNKMVKVGGEAERPKPRTSGEQEY